MRRSSRLNQQPPPRQPYTLIPIKAPGSRKSDGSIMSIQEYYTNVTKNSITINRALRDGVNLESEAYSAPINQPRPSFGVARQIEQEESSESPRSPEIAQEEDPIEQRTMMQNIYDAFTNGLQRLRGNRIVPTNTNAQQTRSQRPSRNTRVKTTLEQNINTLYNVNNNLYRYFNNQQLLYLATPNIMHNYYYRRLELYYTNAFLDKFNDLAYNILLNMSNGVDESSYRYDIEYFNTIQGYYTSITGKVYRQYRTSARFNSVGGVSGDSVIIKNKTRTIANIIREIEKNKSNEIVLLNTYIRDLDWLLTQRDIITDQDVMNNITTFKERLTKRFRKLTTIRHSDLEALFSTEEYENKRKNLIYILKSLSILCITFMIIIYKIKFFVTAETVDIIMPEVSQEMYEAIEYFSRVINRDISIRDRASINEMETIINEQYTLFKNIKRNVVDLAGIINQDVGNNNYLDFSIYINNDSSRLDSQNRETLSQELNETEFETRNRQNLERLERRRQLVIERYNIINAERQQRREERTAAQRAAQQAAEAARQAAATARQQRQQSRGQSRGTAATQARTATQARGSYQITTINEVPDDAYTNKIEYINIHDLFKRNSDSVINKLKDKYKKYNRTLNDIDKPGFYNSLKKKYETYFNLDERQAPIPIIRDSIKNYIGYSVASLFARYIHFNYDMKFNDLSKYFVINFTINSDGGTISEARQAGIDVGGLRRDFITSLITELFNPNNGIFMTREGTKKYFLNPNFVPDEFYRYIITKRNTGYNIDTNFNNDFYKFIGELITFILVNDCGLEHYLSSYLIASLSITTPFDDMDYVYFMLEDFPEYTMTLLNLLKGDPENIEYVYIGFNDYFNLRHGDVDITKDNIDDFIKECAKYIMTKTIIRKDIDSIPAGSNYNNIIRKGEEINAKFVNGIPQDIKSYISGKGIPLLTLTSYLIKPLMSQEIIGKLKRNFINSMQRHITNNANLGKIVELFSEYVLNNKFGNSEAIYFKYIENLIKFWSGSAFYKDTEKYKIVINTNLSNEHLPQSHTCFFTIDIPLYTGTDEDIGKKLYDKIELAITNVETGIGLAGGKIPYKRNNKRINK
jgi:hypothetical protein